MTSKKRTNGKVPVRKIAKAERNPDRKDGEYPASRPVIELRRTLEEVLDKSDGVVVAMRRLSYPGGLVEDFQRGQNLLYGVLCYMGMSHPDDVAVPILPPIAVPVEARINEDDRKLIEKHDKMMNEVDARINRLVKAGVLRKVESKSPK